MSNNFRKYPKTKARKIWGYKHIQGLRTFVFKFKVIQGLSSFVRTLKIIVSPGMDVSTGGSSFCLKLWFKYKKALPTQHCYNNEVNSLVWHGIITPRQFHVSGIN
jgi:hypothetical protein